MTLLLMLPSSSKFWSHVWLQIGWRHLTAITIWTNNGEDLWSLLAFGLHVDDIVPMLFVYSRATFVLLCFVMPVGTTKSWTWDYLISHFNRQSPRSLHKLVREFSVKLMGHQIGSNKWHLLRPYLGVEKTVIFTGKANITGETGYPAIVNEVLKIGHADAVPNASEPVS